MSYRHNFLVMKKLEQKLYSQNAMGLALTLLYCIMSGTHDANMIAIAHSALLYYPELVHMFFDILEQDLYHIHFANEMSIQHKIHSNLNTLTPEGNPLTECLS